MPAATPVFQFAVPAPYDTGAIYGEKALSVHSPINQAPARTNFVLTTWADLEGGEYLLRVVALQASSWATAVTYGNSRVFFYTKRDSGPQIAMVHLPRGRQRIDILLSNLSLVPAECWVAFSLWRQGKLVYASEASSWVMVAGGDTANDEEVPSLGDKRLRMPVFSFLPNWKQGLDERISYSTEVLASETDTEQRRSLRIIPRRSIEATFLRQQALRSRLDVFLSSIGKNQFLLPMWHEQYRLTETLGLTLIFPAGSLAFREFRSLSLALVFGKDPAVYEVLEVAEVNIGTDAIQFANVPVGVWGDGSRIVPLRVARILESPSLSNITDAVATSTIRFQIDDAEPEWFEPSWNVDPQLFNFKLNRALAISVGYERPSAYTMQYGYGPTDVFDSEQKSRLSVRGAVTMRGREQVLAFRKFIAMTRGRAVRFWLPTGTSDIYCTASTISGDTLDIKSIGFTDYFKTEQGFRLIIAVEYRDAQLPPVYRTIGAFEEISTAVERLTLTESLPTIQLSAVKRISFLMAVRFDQDTFELHHHVDESAAVQTSVVFKTADDDGMVLDLALGPVTYLTSLLYPIEVIESMQVTTSALNGYLFQNPQDNLDVTSTLLSGTLETNVKTMSSDPESLDVTSALLSGTLITVLIPYSSDPESLDVTSELLSGTLLTVLIAHSDPADDEQLDVTSTLLGGTLG